jgi:SAM-dependent methyltransferase
MTDPTPKWLRELLDLPAGDEDLEVDLAGQTFVFRDGIWRSRAVVSAAQQQTAETFGFKWAQRATFESEASVRNAGAWLRERYGDVADAGWWSDHGPTPLVLDAGCGAGFSALALFGDRLDAVRYLGVDVSSAVDVAAARFAEAGHPCGLLQADLGALPLAPGSVDVVFSEGVLHHTDSTEKALHAACELLRPGGRILFYVYRRKGPIREFTDDHLREALQSMTPQEGWDALLPLSRLGRTLGELEIELDVPEAVELLGIPAGRIDLQRFFYWHVCKAYYRPELDLDELNHINFDWFAPANAHRQSPEEVRAWCADAGLVVEREDVQEAGITIVGRKT